MVPDPRPDDDAPERPASARDFGFLIGIVMALALAMFVGSLGGRDAERRKSYPEQYAATAKQNAARACVTREPETMFECVYEHVEASQDQANSKQDLTAQQEMARWALLMAGATFGSLVLTAFALWFIKGTLDETKKMAADTKTMADQSTNATLAMVSQNRLAEQQQRAWLEIEADGLDTIKYNESFAESAVNIRLKNLGETPVVSWRVECWLHTDFIGNLSGELGALQDLMSFMREFPVFGGRPIVKGQVVEWRQAIRRRQNPNPVQWGEKPGSREITDPFKLCLLLCVNYKTVFDTPDTIKEAGVCYTVHQGMRHGQLAGVFPKLREGSLTDVGLLLRNDFGVST